MNTVPTAAAAPPVWPHALTTRLSAALRHPWVASVVGLAAVEDALQALRPTLSLTAVRARVTGIIDETADTRTFVLKPNALWIGAQAGQFVRVRVEIDGRRHERAYSLTSPPGARRLAITVKRQPGGLVSQYLHDAVKPGSILTLSQAAGEFVLPSGLPDKILLFCAGSGITPIMALLHALKARAYRGDVLVYHVCRTRQEFIFLRQLQQLAATWPSLRLRSHITGEAGRWHVASLQAVVPDLALRATWLCGPAALMDEVHRLWDEDGYASPLHSERFAAPPLHVATAPDEAVMVRLAASGRQFTARGGEPLLLQAERAGLALKHGCRIGICHSCQCIKTRGSVQNLQTGAVSTAPDELIRLCVSAAHSDLMLDL